MKATTLLRNKSVEAIAAESSTIAPAALACHAHLIKADFDSDEATDFTTLTEATFTGGAAKSAGIGAQQSGVDPQTGARFVQLLEPAGGWTWKCTAAPAASETIYGMVLTDNADAVTLASEKLPTPVTISAVNDTVTFGNFRLALPNSVFA